MLPVHGTAIPVAVNFVPSSVVINAQVVLEKVPLVRVYFTETVVLAGNVTEYVDGFTVMPRGNGISAQTVLATPLTGGLE